MTHFVFKNARDDMIRVDYYSEAFLIEYGPIFSWSISGINLGHKPLPCYEYSVGHCRKYRQIPLVATFFLHCQNFSQQEFIIIPFHLLRLPLCMYRSTVSFKFVIVSINLEEKRK